MSFIKNTIILYFIFFLGIFISSVLFAGISISGIEPLAYSALIITILNATFKPIFLILTFPLKFLTFGLFIFFVNALVFLLTSFVVGFFIEEGFAVASLTDALFGSFIISFLRILFEEFKVEKDEE